MRRASQSREQTGQVARKSVRHVKPTAKGQEALQKTLEKTSRRRAQALPAISPAWIIAEEETQSQQQLADNLLLLAIAAEIMASNELRGHYSSLGMDIAFASADDSQVEPVVEVILLTDPYDPQQLVA